MSGIIKNTLRGLTGESYAPDVNLNQRFTSGGSALQNGNLNLDPSIRNIQNSALTGFNNLLADSQNNRADYSQFGTGFGNLGQEFAGNQGALINARLNPLRQNISQRRGQLSNELGRRGVFGTFANQSKNNFELDAARQLGDAQALANQDALNARTNILGQQFGVAQAQDASNRSNLGFEAGLNQLIQSVGAERFTQELQGLGLSVNTVNALLGRAQNSAQLKDTMQQAGFQNGLKVADMIGKGIAACWVAEELYGSDHEKTHTIRAHVKKHAFDENEKGQFFRDYINNGERWADELREGKHDRDEMMKTWDGLYEDAVGENHASK